MTLGCFFSSVFINNTEQAGATAFCAIKALDSCCGMRVSEKELDMLRGLGPMYTEESL
jgi:hypothetical protein